MRLSVFDPGFRPRVFEVFLDGEVVKDCQIADEETGEVRVLERNSAGEFFARDGDTAYKILKGKVKIRRLKFWWRAA